MLRWLEDKRKVKHGLKIVDWKPKRETNWSLSSVLGQAIGGGISMAVREAVSSALQETGFAAIQLDGLVSVWHPAKN